MSEGEPVFSREPLPREALETLKHPEQVFDSALEVANDEHRLVMEKILRLGETYRVDQAVALNLEYETSALVPIIQIAWPVNSQQAMLLHLNPISEGRGPEKGVFGYLGSYGLATKHNHSWKPIADKTVSLDKLYQAPDGLTLIVKPTIDRWAIGVDELSLVFGQSTRTLYMGLGFLFLDKRWMHIGMHEAGHLPRVDDENQAWHKANVAYTAIHKGYQQDIVSGKSHGLFSLLQRPIRNLDKPTIGQIMKYGLTSHYAAGNARLPLSWQQEVSSTLDQFRRLQSMAHDAYSYILG